jgi:hypothetical protein
VTDRRPVKGAATPRSPPLIEQSAEWPSPRSRSKTVGFDGGFVAHKHFWIGAYLQFTPFSFERLSGEKVLGEGSGFLGSGGLSAKARVPIGDAFVLRGGLTLGRNVVSYDGKSKSSGDKFELSGGGFNVGAVIDGAWRASQKVGASMQLGFVSQVSGSAEVKGYPTKATAEGTNRDFGFSPIFFLTVGPELFL